MKNYHWNEAKNELLQEERQLSFSDVVEAIENHKLLNDLQHPNKEKFPNQRLLIVEIKGYAHVVPYVLEEDGSKFLKTIYPDRRNNAKYLNPNH